MSGYKLSFIEEFQEDERIFQMCQDNLLKDCRDTKKTLKVEQDDNGTHITALATAKDYIKNSILIVPVETSTPLNLEVYDTVRDAYVVEGVDFVDLGHIPVNYRVAMESAQWYADVPVPPSVIRRYISAEQKKKLDRFKSRWNGKLYDITYLQSLQVY